VEVVGGCWVLCVWRVVAVVVVMVMVDEGACVWRAAAGLCTWG
jgi:hypothetical protein